MRGGLAKLVTLFIAAWLALTSAGLSLVWSPTPANGSSARADACGMACGCCTESTASECCCIGPHAADAAEPDGPKLPRLVLRSPECVSVTIFTLVISRGWTFAEPSAVAVLPEPIRAITLPRFESPLSRSLSPEPPPPRPFA